MIALTLPLPPSVNELYFNMKGKGRVKTRAYRSYMRSAGWVLMGQRPGSIEGPVQIKISLPASNRKDPDNCAKALLDLLVAHRVIADDNPKIVREVVITTTEPAPGSDCIITINAYEVEHEEA